MKSLLVMRENSLQSKYLKIAKKINIAAQNPEELKDKNRYIVYKRHAGFGDIMTGLYYAWQYAHATHRKLIVDWRWSTYVYNSSNLFSYLFGDCSIRGTQIIGSNIEKIEFPSPFYPSFYNNQNIHDKPVYDRDGPYPTLKDKNAMLSDLMSFRNWEEKTIVLHEKIRPFPVTVEFDQEVKNFMSIMWHMLPAHITKHIEDTCNELFKELENIIGLHLRLGNKDKSFYDYINNSPLRSEKIKKYDGSNIRQYIYKEIAPMIESISEVNRLFVATDSKEAYDSIKEVVPNCITYNKWFPLPGSEIHFATANNLDIIRDSLTELYLLSQCNKIYSTFTHSAYAKVAGSLNKRPEVIFL